MNEELFNTWTQVIVDKLACHARNWQLTRRVDIAEIDRVEQREAIGKLLIEVASASVKMRL